MTLHSTLYTVHVQWLKYWRLPLPLLSITSRVDRRIERDYLTWVVLFIDNQYQRLPNYTVFISPQEPTNQSLHNVCNNQWAISPTVLHTSLVSRNSYCLPYYVLCTPSSTNTNTNTNISDIIWAQRPALLWRWKVEWYFSSRLCR